MTPPQLTAVEAPELLAQQYGLTGQLSTLPENGIATFSSA